MSYYESSVPIPAPQLLQSSSNVGNKPPYNDDNNTNNISSSTNNTIIIPYGYPKYVMALDIESLGPDVFVHALVAIGAVVVEVSTNKVVEYFSCYMNIGDDYGYDPVCREEYWDNHEKFPMNIIIKERFTTSNISTQEGIKLFANWLDACESKYANKGKMHFVTDTIGYDAAWITHHFAKWLGRLPLDHQFGDPKLYRSLKHTNDFAKGVLGAESFSEGSWREKLVNKGVELPDDSMHCHDPKKDAEYIAKTYVACLRYLISCSCC